MENTWHTKTISDILSTLHSEERGLTAEEVSKRIKEYGYNKLPESKPDGLPVIFLRQFQSPLIYILLLASAIVFFMGETIDASIILAVLLFNATVGTVQEGKAQNTLLALKRFVDTKATVLRDGKELIIPDTEVVIGDIILLSEGEKVPADARIITSNSIKVDEAAMTGESEPVQKIAEVLNGQNIATADQKNMLFKGTHIVSGNGRAVVIGTGSNTVIGKIAKQIATIDTEIPLKTNIRNLSRLIIITVALISMFLFTFGIILGKPVKEMFTTIVSLAVSVIPEGLPIVVTLVLATGVSRMSKRNALVKKLQAVEALGQARIIAVDKTGTITKNELVIQKVFLPAGEAGIEGKMFEVGGVGYEPKGDIRLNGKLTDAINQPGLAFAGQIAAYCASARVMFSAEENLWRVAGDPTEAAMLVFAQKLGMHKDEMEQEMPILSEIPFDYKLKYHAVVHGNNEKKILTIVGAPEVILGLSNKIWRDGKNHHLDTKEKEELEATFVRMSQEGLRVIAFAETSNAPHNLTPETINNLTFVGFYGMKDALRTEVADALQRATRAGIRVVMITGDHKITAQSIASEAGIYHEGDNVLTGEDIDTLSEKELAEKLATTSVFARVNPDHKLTIIKAFRARGEIVAMTGDGVNDAPSLVAADLGVALGNGSEVAKEAADIVLLDDNFGSIVSAVEEGRSIYKTIKKVILYLFAGSASQVFTILGALFLGYPLPLLAAQIIWLNFVTDGFLAVSLAMEPKEEGLLRGNFERPKKYLIDKLMAKRMLLMSLPLALGTLYLFQGYLDVDLTKAWTIVLTTLAAGHWFNAWNCRSDNKSIFQMNPFSNKFLVRATITIILLQLFAVYNPLMQKFLRTTALDLSDWLLIIPIAASIVLFEEVRKFFYRRKYIQ